MTKSPIDRPSAPPEAPPALTVVTAPAREFKLDLACGQNCREGFESVDLWPGAKYVSNLMKIQWPWVDHSVDELHGSHFMEHLLRAQVFPHVDFESVQERSEDSDFFFAFFDERHGILRLGGLNHQVPFRSAQLWENMKQWA